MWWFIGPLDFKRKVANLEGLDRHRSIGARLLSYPLTILKGAKLFVLSIVRGGTLIFGSRKLIWLFPCYALALYGHRYLENGLAPVRDVMLVSC